MQRATSNYTATAISEDAVQALTYLAKLLVSCFAVIGHDEAIHRCHGSPTTNVTVMLPDLSAAISRFTEFDFLLDVIWSANEEKRLEQQEMIDRREAAAMSEYANFQFQVQARAEFQSQTQVQAQSQAQAQAQVQVQAQAQAQRAQATAHAHAAHFEARGDPHLPPAAIQRSPSSFASFLPHLPMP